MNRPLKTIWNERVSWRNTTKWPKKRFKLDNRNDSKDRWKLVNPLRCSLALFTLSRSDQLVGLEWWRTLHEVGLNGNLADEMGLRMTRLVEGSTTFLSLFRSNGSSDLLHLQSGARRSRRSLFGRCSTVVFHRLLFVGRNQRDKIHRFTERKNKNWRLIESGTKIIIEISHVKFFGKQKIIGDVLKNLRDQRQTTFDSRERLGIDYPEFMGQDQSRIEKAKKYHRGHCLQQGRRNDFWVGGAQVPLTIFGGAQSNFSWVFAGRKRSVRRIFQKLGGLKPPQPPRFRRLWPTRCSTDRMKRDGRQCSLTDLVAAESMIAWKTSRVRRRICFRFSSNCSCCSMRDGSTS